MLKSTTFLFSFYLGLSLTLTNNYTNKKFSFYFAFKLNRIITTDIEINYWVNMSTCLIVNFAGGAEIFDDVLIF